MSFPVFSEYKNSGVQWLPLAPKHWNIERFGRVLKEREERSESGNETLLSVSAYTGVSPRSEIIDEEDHLTRSDSLVGYKVCYPKDLVINIMLAWNRGLGVSQYHGIVSPAYCVFSISKDFDSRFIDYLVRTNEYTAYFKSFSTGVIDSRLRIYPDVLKSLTVIYPNKEEQIKIVEYLDHETVKINSLISEQEKLIELLKEKRQAVIAHAVTNGLDPNVKMKDSGVKWLGQVPEHWTVAPLKYFFQVLDKHRIPLSAEERSYRAGEFPYYGASGPIDNIDAYLFDEDLILVSEDGANLLNRNLPIAFLAKGKYWVNNHAHILKPVDGHLKFWSNRIESIDITPYVTGSAQPKFTIEALTNLVLTVPPTNEEITSISNFIEKQASELDTLLNESLYAIKLLIERRSALISAAVTGQIDVRNVAITKEAA